MRPSEAARADDPATSIDVAPARMSPITLEGSLRREELNAVVDGAKMVLGDTARTRLKAGNQVLVRRLAAGVNVYGVSSGVGDLRDIAVASEACDDLQRNIVRSHCCGIGPPLPARLVRGALALRAATFACGYSAVRPQLVERMLAMLNARIHPIVPAQGSVGASGDPVLLAHVAYAITGEGTAQLGDGARRSVAELLARVGLEPMRLTGREGLALLNGLDFTIAAAVLLHADADRLFGWSDTIAALTLDALSAASASFSIELQRLRGEGRHCDVATRIADLRRWGVMAPFGSAQDPYCLRCIPQVHGASWTALDRHAATVDRELTAVIDNPLIFPEPEVVYHCGHFHGQELAFSADHLALAVTSLANIAQARISLLLRGTRGLPRMLSREPGVRCGLMMLETTSASLVARMRTAATPLSIQSLPASSEQEDHTSMAWEAVRRTDALLSDLAGVLAVEAIAAVEALRFRRAPLDIVVPAPMRAALGNGTSELELDSSFDGELESLRSVLLRQIPEAVA
jgi:histidine ammonia-lyase